MTFKVSCTCCEWWWEGTIEEVSKAAFNHQLSCEGGTITEIIEEK